MHTKTSIAVVLCMTVASCQADSGEQSGTDTDPTAEESGATSGSSGNRTSGDVPGSSDASTSGTSRGSATTVTTNEAGTSEGPTTDAQSTGFADSGSEGSTGELEEIAVLNIESAASAMNGDSLVISNYTAPADGILVVRGGAAGPVVQSVTFGGEPLTSIASHHEPDYWFAIAADMYWIPVTAGESGDISWQYQPGEWTTRRRGMIALTISGVDEVHALVTNSDGLGTNQGRTGPFAAELDITTTQEAVILSAFTSNGPGPSDLTGAGHVLDAFPTIPIEEFHSTRVYGGHAQVGPGTFAFGYENAEAGGWFDYVLFLAAFTRSESTPR